MFKKENGVTLVALVITIIVLLILAGVSIALVSGDNGVLTKAQKSSTKTKHAQIVEGTGLALTDLQSEYADQFAEGNASQSSMPSYFYEEKLVAALKGQGYRLYKRVGTEKTEGETTKYEFSGAFTEVKTPTENQQIDADGVQYRVGPESSNEQVDVQFKKGSLGYTAKFGGDLKDGGDEQFSIN